MPIFNLTDLRGRTSRRGDRLLGLDPGSRTIGVALSDVTLMLASPYGSLRRGKLAANAPQIAGIAGKEGWAGWWSACRCRWTAQPGRRRRRRATGRMRCRAATGLPAALWDERLSYGCGQSLPDRRGRPHPHAARRGGGPDGGGLHAASGPRR